MRTAIIPHDYAGLARAIARRRFPVAWASIREDLCQECELLAWEALHRGRIQVGHGKTRKVFGVGCKPGRLGIRPFMRAAYRRLYGACRNYGLGNYELRGQ